MKFIRIKLNARRNICSCLIENNAEIIEIELNYDIVLQFKLSINKSINQDEYNEIILANSKFNARTQAYRIATYKRRTEFEVITKLRQKGYQDEVIKNAIAFLYEFNLLNDNEFARIFISDKSKIKLWGERRIKVELLRKGIKEDIIFKELNNFNLDDTKLESALILANKKFNQIKYKKDKVKITNSIVSFLQRNGYDYNIIKQVIEELKLLQN